MLGTSRDYHWMRFSFGPVPKMTVHEKLRGRSASTILCLDEPGPVSPRILPPARG
ncbi:MAG: hypothetical protein NVSMB22_16170 [Chloroflexota bacterium]